MRDALRAFRRVDAVELLPELGRVFDSGDTSGSHVDLVTRAIKELDADQRAQFADRGQVLATAAVELTPDEFGRVVRAEVRRIQVDDGLDRLLRQQRATRLRTWVDRESGMWCLRGEFDPETGLVLDGRLRTMVEALFRETTPDTCPKDPEMKQDHLRALALVALTEGRGGGRMRTEINILIDAATLFDGEHAESIIDCGIPIDIPIETVRRMACCADVIVPIISAADGVALYLGRDTRLANRAQRRALRAMYRGCAAHGCRVAFDKCQIHHLRWFRRGGFTDVDNLLPVCDKHHHLVHEGGWNLALDQHRNLTITYPDGTIMTTGPPKRRAG